MSVTHLKPALSTSQVSPRPESKSRKRKRRVDPESVSPSAEEQAYLHIRNEILSGVYSPGERLPEETVARQVGVSRTPVRGALHRLMIEGFIEYSRYVGAVVRVLPPEEIDQLFQLRSVVESFAAEAAARSATEEDIEVLENLCQLMESVVRSETPNLLELAQLNKKFHRKLLSSCGNVFVSRIAENLGDLNIMFRSYNRYSHAALMRSMGHHRELVLALRNRNAQWARNVMASHIESARSSSRESMSEAPDSN